MASKSTEYKIAIKIAGQVENSLKSSLGTAAKGITSMAKTCATASVAAVAALGAMGVKAVNIGKEFESAMSQVSATMLIDKTTEEGAAAFETLENAARECGASTAFSATEAAEALNYLALAGYDADKAAGALPTVLRLAGAGAMELADASDMVTDAMSALGIEATQANLESFADQLAKTASVSNTSVAQLGEAILTVGGTAKDLAGGTTELNTALGILADNGIKGAEGGTHLRNMLLSLQNPRNSNAAELFENLGLSAYDAQGNMRSLGDIFGDLNDKMAGLSAEDVNSTLATIFKQTDLAAARAMLAATADSVTGLGTVIDSSLAENGKSLSQLGINLDKIAAGFDSTMTSEQFAAQMMEQYGLDAETAGLIFDGMSSIVEGTGNRFDELTGKINDSVGACQQMYDIQLDNLDGDLAKCSSAAQDLAISAYQAMNGPLRKAVQMATGWIGDLATAFSESGFSGVAGAIGGVIAEAVEVIASYAPGFMQMAIYLLMSFITGISGSSPQIAQAAAETLTVFFNGIIAMIPELLLLGLDLIVQFAQSMESYLPMIMDNGTQVIGNFVQGIIQRLPTIIMTALLLVQTLANSIGQNSPQLIQSALLLVSSLIIGIIQMLPGLLQTGIQLVLQLVYGIIQNMPLVLQTGALIILNLVNSLTQMLPMLIQSGIQLIISLIQGLIQNLPEIARAAITIVLSLIGGLICAIPQLKAAVPLLKNAIWDTLIHTNWLELGWNIVLSIGQGILDGFASIGSSILNTITGWFGGGKEEADASRLGAQVIGSYTEGLDGGTGSAQAAAQANAQAALEGLQIDTTAATQLGTDLGNSYTLGLTTGMEGVTTTANSMGTDIVNSLNSSITTAQPALDSSAMQIGTDMMASLNTGMGDGAFDVENIMDGIATSGGSSFTELQTSVSSITTETTNQLTQLWEQAGTELSNTWSSFSGKFSSAWSSVHSTAVSAAQNTASAIKAAFENMKITIPRPSIPKINVAYSTVSGGGAASVQVPNFSVSYYAAGGIMTNPTAFGMNPANGSVMIGGEAGAEAIVPLSELWDQMRTIVSDIIESAAAGSGIPGFQKLLGTIKGEDKPKQGGGSDDSGMVITYAPVYHFEGDAPSRDDLREAEKMSQEEFNRMMERWKKDNDRKKF